MPPDISQMQPSYLMVMIFIISTLTILFWRGVGFLFGML
jgi:hypothetical protein